MHGMRSLMLLLVASSACVFDGELLVPAGGAGGGGASPATGTTTGSATGGGGGGSAGGASGAGGSGGESVEPYFDCDLSGPLVAEELDSWEFGTCARLSDGSVHCWGWDSWGQLGRGFYDLQNDNPNPIEVTLPGPAHQVEVLTAGCAIVGDCDAPELYCWGRNDGGQAGQQPVNVAEVLPPTKVSLPGPVLDVALGTSHTCAIVVVAGERAVFCWGQSASGQCGTIAPGILDPTMVAFADGEVPIDVVAGDKTTCARVEVAGAPAGVRCWGSNEHGLLGDAGPDDPTPSPHPNLGGALGLEMDGDRSGCAFTDELVGCWGSNGFGQLNGVPDSDPHPSPLFFDLSDTVSVSISPLGALARTSDGSWYAIGDGKLGPKTDPTPPPFTTFEQVGTLDDFTVVAASGNYCGINELGDVRCWGNLTNYKGCMGPNFTRGNALHGVPLP